MLYTVFVYTTWLSHLKHLLCWDYICSFSNCGLFGGNGIRFVLSASYFNTLPLHK